MLQSRITAGRQVMLLDEPSMGLAPLLMMDMFDALKKINEEGTTILLVEQNARLALKFAQRGHVLETGHVVVESKAADLETNPCPSVFIRVQKMLKSITEST